MRNIHILPTTPNDETGKGVWIKETRDWCNIYITSDEEIKEGDYCIDGDDIYGPFEEGDIATVKFIKIILTNDEQLIRYDVQAIDDEFLEWFVKNTSCEEIEVIYTNCANCVKIQGQELSPDCCHNYQYKIIIPKEEPKPTKVLSENGNELFFDEKGYLIKEEPKQETFNSKRGLKEVQLKDPNTCEHYKEVGCIKDVCNCYTLISKQETLEEVAEKYANNWEEIHPELDPEDMTPVEISKIDFLEGAKEQAERMYSEEDLQEKTLLAMIGIMQEYSYINESSIVVFHQEWFEKFKKK